MFDFIKGADKVNSNVSCAAIIVAAGNSTRMKNTENKQFVEILGKPVLAYTLEAFEECDLVSQIIIVTKEEDIVYCNNAIVEEYGFTKVKKIIAGGEERQQSVYNGLKEVEQDADIVVIHDGARPLVDAEDIEKSIFECIESKAVVIGVKIKDTIKMVDQNGFVVETPDRQNLWIAQTPQTFDYKIILKAHEIAKQEGLMGTDDAVLVERLGYKVKVVEGKYENIKITTEDDLKIVEAFL